MTHTSGSKFKESLAKMKDRHHKLVQLKHGKVYDARMVTLDELRSQGAIRAFIVPSGEVSSYWVRDLETGEKLKDEPCDAWILDKHIAAWVSVASYPTSTNIEPLFGFVKHTLPKQER